MTTILSTSVGGVTIAAAIALPFMMRAPRTVEEMIESLDEELLHRLAWFADGPKRDTVEAFEIMEAMNGRMGLFRLLNQARLMTGITIEALKPGGSPAIVLGMRRLRWALWRAVAGCLLSPSVHAYKVAMIASEMAALQETVLIEFDAGT